MVKYEQTQPYCVHNGRKWQMGKKKKNSRNFGHLKGVETVKKIVRASIKLNVSIVTFYVFSTENWKRPKAEINFLFKIIKNYFYKEIQNLIVQGIKINILGDIDKLSNDIKKSFSRNGQQNKTKQKNHSKFGNKLRFKKRNNKCI